MSTGLSYGPNRVVKGPTYLPDLTIHPPGRLHRVVMFYQGKLDPQRTHLLREVADKGKNRNNNRFGTKLRLSTWAVSPRGRLRLFAKDPEHIAESFEEFGRFCKEQVGFELNGLFEGKAQCEVGYDVSGSVEKYVSVRVRVELRGYKAKFFFDKSLGDWELEAHVQGQGTPNALHEFTSMIVANASMTQYLTDLPAKIVAELSRLTGNNRGIHPTPNPVKAD